MVAAAFYEVINEAVSVSTYIKICSMWKLKVAEGQGPWLYSLNNFIGRQIWEFDPQAGTQEELEEIRKVQENFTKNRFRYKPNGDLLMRMQVYMLCSFYSL